GASTKSTSDAKPETGAELATSKTVHLPKSYKFSPDKVEVATGAVVTWINEDDFPHTVHLLDGSDVDRKLGVGERTQITFDEPGVYRYDCSLHPTQMKGQVVVHEGGES
ncbi:MAG TPA: plastocyanin/azurin family copper-binding protein, partial [Actinomycetota bacterium]|nr:plastocyanin/azurin family copper-binding protein [Actinomycetota bacterium]